MDLNGTGAVRSLRPAPFQAGLARTGCGATWGMRARKSKFRENRHAIFREMVSSDGFEPSATALKVRCSTAELRARPFRGAHHRGDPPRGQEVRSDCPRSTETLKMPGAGTSKSVSTKPCNQLKNSEMRPSPFWTPGTSRAPSSLRRRHVPSRRTTSRSSKSSATSTTEHWARRMSSMYACSSRPSRPMIRLP